MITKQELITALSIYNRPASFTELYELIVVDKPKQMGKISYDKFRLAVISIIEANHTLFKKEYPYNQRKAAISLRRPIKTQTTSWERLINDYIKLQGLTSRTKNEYRSSMLHFCNELFPMPPEQVDRKDVDAIIQSGAHTRVQARRNSTQYHTATTLKYLLLLNRLSKYAKSIGVMKVVFEDSPHFKQYSESTKKYIASHYRRKSMGMLQRIKAWFKRFKRH